MKSKRAFLFIAPIVLIPVAVFKFGVFNVSKINIEINNATCIKEQNVLQEISPILKNIIFINAFEINNKILGRYPCVRQVDLKREFPKDIKLNVLGRNPLLRIQSYVVPQLPLENLEATPSSRSALLDWSFPKVQEDSIWIVDETGMVFNKDEKSELPLVFYPWENLQLGIRIDPGIIVKVNTVINKFSLLNLPIYRGKILNNDFLIESQYKMAISLSKDVPRQLASLQLILQEAKINKRIMETIDLRFDKPVIVYFPKK